MSVRSISSNIQNLQAETQGFEFQTASLLAPLQGRALSTGSVEENHLRVIEVFTRTMRAVSELKEDIHRQTTYANQEEMFLTATTVTDFETRLEAAMNRLNDTLLTSYPTAKIAYGKACIGPRIAPVIEGCDIKIQQAVSKCSCIRQIRGDGNCFPSAFTTRFLESLVQRKAVENFIQFVSEDGIDQPDLKGEILNTLFTLNEYPSQLERILGDNQRILPFISYFRLLAADEMKKNPDHYDIFFRADLEHVYGAHTEGQSLNALVDKYVIPMGIDFSHPMITALCQRVQFPVRILDPRIGSADGVNILDGQEPQGTFCRKGAHYFVLYTPEEASPIAQSSPSHIVVRSTPKPTEIFVKCEVPFMHSLFIRGEGNGLSWERGLPLMEVGEGQWAFFPEEPLKDGTEYKFVFDDQIWEDGNNHKVIQGKLDGANPKFKLPSNLAVQDVSVAPVKTTKITIKFDAGLGNKLFIRGTGPGMSWDRGVELRNVGADVWVFETQANFPNLEYKILLNDKQWEQGNNHKTDCGKKEEVKPKF